MKIVTVIVTIYNSDKYISNCIENIQKQPYHDIELLLIDDGSTDASGRICDEHAAKDPRIKVFHEVHHGVAHSRQVGIDNACGEYFIFVDADDTIQPAMFEEMYAAAKRDNAEMVISDYTELTNDGDIYKCQEPSQLIGQSVMDDIIEGKLYGALWNKLIKTDIVKKNNVRFHEKLSMREDMIFLSNLLPYIYRVSYIPKAFYGYERRNVKSLTNNYLDESIEYYRQEILWNRLLLESKHLSEKSRLKILTYYGNLAYITLHDSMFDSDEWHENFDRYKYMTNGYKPCIVAIAQNGCFTVARTIRTFLSKVGRIR